VTKGNRYPDIPRKCKETPPPLHTEAKLHRKRRRPAEGRSAARRLKTSGTSCSVPSPILILPPPHLPASSSPSVSQPFPPALQPAAAAPRTKAFGSTARPSSPAGLPRRRGGRLARSAASHGRGPCGRRRRPRLPTRFFSPTRPRRSPPRRRRGVLT
jgi:hypothetical protein